jgi:nonsense-mediated mRNA decay protein 3
MAKELVSHDPRSNIYNYKHTYCVEIVPICKDDVVCLPAALSRQIGNMAQICVVLRVTQVVQLMDVSTCHGMLHQRSMVCYM